MKLDKLTAEQEVMLPAIRNKWLSIGLSTEPADRKRAEAGVALAYQAAGMKPPSLVIWLRSPLEGAYGATLLKGDQVKDQVWDQVRDEVWDKVGDQVRANVRDEVWANVWANVRANVRDEVWDKVRAQVGDQVRAQVWANVRDEVGDKVRANVRDEVRDQVRANVRDEVWANVWDNVWDKVRDEVWANVRDEVRANVRDEVWDNVWDKVRAQVGDQVRAQVWDQVWKAAFGCHDANWLGFYAAFNCFGIEATNKLRGLQEVAQSCGWWWPFADAVILTERPNKILRDDQNRLHCETGPALSYPDGFSIYAWHGTRLPAEWVENRTTIDPAIILKAGNVEQRAAGAALIGWPRMLKVLKEKVVDDSGSPDIGQLIELTLPGLPEPGRFLKAVCPRNGIICEGVPYVSDIDNLPINTALHAQAWRIGDPLSDYQHPPART